MRSPITIPEAHAAAVSPIPRRDDKLLRMVACRRKVCCCRYEVHRGENLRDWCYFGVGSQLCIRNRINVATADASSYSRLGMLRMLAISQFRKSSCSLLISTRVLPTRSIWRITKVNKTHQRY